LGSTGGGPLSRIVVKNLFVEKFERFGVELHNANNVLVDSNIIKNATALDGGGQGYGVVIDEALSSNNWIRNNTIGPVIRHAILIQRAHNNLIENNRITGTVSGAIDLHGEDEYANEIRYNTISDGVRNGTTVSPNGAGIEVGEYSGVIGTDLMHDNSGPGNWIHHNTVYNYSYGLRIMNNSNYTYIEDNVFRNNSGPGILADLAPLNNLDLSRNQVNNNAHGIILYDVTQAVVTDNIVRYNSGYGIAINPGTTDYVITGNTVTNNGVNVYLTNTNGTYIPKSNSTAVPFLWWA
jgi:parallel beta-helix repeat protein